MMAKKCPSVKFTVVDDDERRVAAFKSSSLLPFYEPGMAETLDDVKGTNLFFSTDFDGAVRDADMVFVSVSTPLKDGGAGAGYAPDLVHWEIVARRISKAAGGPKVIVERSTVPATAGKSMAKILKANSPHAMVVLSNPEFAREGNAMVDHASPERVPSAAPRRGGAGGDRAAGGALLPVGAARQGDHPESVVGRARSSRTPSSRSASHRSTRSRRSARRRRRRRRGLLRRRRRHADRPQGDDGVGRLRRRVLRDPPAQLVYLASVSRLPQVAKYWQAVINMNEWQKRRFATKVVSAMFNT